MRPAVLCKLQQGKWLDEHDGFVDTFNWLVDFCSNFCGDGDLDSSKKLTLDKSIDDRPVMRFDGDSAGEIGVADNQIVVTGVEWTGSGSDHPYTIKISRGRLAVGADGTDNAGKLYIAADPTLTQYIDTVAHSSEIDPDPAE